MKHYIRMLTKYSTLDVVLVVGTGWFKLILFIYSFFTVIDYFCSSAKKAKKDSKQSDLQASQPCATVEQISTRRTRPKMRSRDDLELGSISLEDHSTKLIVLEAKLVRLEKQLHDIYQAINLSSVDNCNKPVFGIERKKLMTLRKLVVPITIPRSSINKVIVVESLSDLYLITNTDYPE